MGSNRGPAQAALVHDYVTQRGGAERVVLELLKVFPGAALHTSTYNPSATYPEFAGHDIRVSPIDRIPAVRRDHRLGLPFYAGVFSRMTIEAELVLCSSSGWAHGAAVTGRKIVYCHNPARWLYQTDQYLRGSRRGVRGGLELMKLMLRRWDRRAAASADRYIVNSTVVAERVRKAYGIEATVVPPPPAVMPGEETPVHGIEPGYFLCVGRLHAYKNVDALVAAFRDRPSERLVVVGDGPYREQLLAAARSNTTFLHHVSDTQLRWLYANSRAVLAASYEDYGLTPLEAASFGKPVAVLRWGGFLDTVVEGATGVFFDEPTAASVQQALDQLTGRTWSASRIGEHSDLYSPDRFADRIRAVVANEEPDSPSPPVVSDAVAS